MRRREFIAGLAGAAAWPVVAQAQQSDRMRRIGVLTAGDENDPVRKRSVSAFTQAIADLVGSMVATCGWTFVGRAATSIGYERSRRNWSACNPISS
jgi:hypothetical protein